MATHQPSAHPLALAAAQRLLRPGQRIEVVTPTLIRVVNVPPRSGVSETPSA